MRQCASMSPGHSCAHARRSYACRRSAGKGGATVNVSSLGALTGSPGAFIDYAASKARSTPRRWGSPPRSCSGIRVNTARPGLIDTEIHNEVGVRIGSSVSGRRCRSAGPARGGGGRSDRVAPLGQGLLHYPRLHRRDRRRVVKERPSKVPRLCLEPLWKRKAEARPRSVFCSVSSGRGNRAVEIRGAGARSH